MREETPSPPPPLPPPPMMQGNGQGNLTSDLLMDAGNVVKKDLVVRFTEEQNAVRHITSAMSTNSQESRNVTTSAGGN